jgi:AcrR family transcriptional regulator
LPADERRQIIVAAAVPLMRAHGRAVTTKAIAAAAGVAEGTVFHVFEDKDALIQAVVAHEFRTDQALQALLAVDPSSDLPVRLTAIVEILRRRLVEVFELMTALGLRRPPEPPPGGSAPHLRLLSQVAELLEPDRAALRYPPAQTAELIRIITFAASHPGITDHRPLDAAQITDLLLNGISHEPGAVAPPGGTSC